MRCTSNKHLCLCESASILLIIQLILLSQKPRCHPTWQDSTDIASHSHKIWIACHTTGGLKGPTRDVVSSAQKKNKQWGTNQRLRSATLISIRTTYLQDFYVCTSDFVFIFMHMMIFLTMCSPGLTFSQQQAVIVFTFCSCSRHTSQYTVDQFVILLLLLWFFSDNVWEDKLLRA